jgi:hypothetical protein
MGGTESYTGRVGGVCGLLMAKEEVDIDTRDESESLVVQSSWLSVSESVSMARLRVCEGLPNTESAGGPFLPAVFGRVVRSLAERCDCTGVESSFEDRSKKDTPMGGYIERCAQLASGMWHWMFELALTMV